MAKQGKERPLKERATLEPTANGDSKFARALGSVDYHTREAGLRAMTAWLSRRGELGEGDLLKLWKGVFYCYWHSDKQPVQAALADRLSEIMTQLPREVGDLYYRTFVRTMRREWFGIDRLRLDKFLMLLRKMFAQLLRQLQAAAWEPQQVADAADFWLHEVLLPGDTLVSAGVAYHLADLLLPELAAVSADAGGPPDAAAAAALLAPFCSALAGTPEGALVYRLRLGLFEPLLEEVRQPSEQDPLHNLDAAALAASMFDLGAQQECRARNREALYTLSGALEKAAAAAQQRRGAAGAAPAAPKPASALKSAAQPAAAASDPAASGPAASKQQKKKRKSSEGAVPLAEAPAVANGVQAGEAAAGAAVQATPKKKKAKLTPAQAALLQQQRLAQLEREQLAGQEGGEERATDAPAATPRAAPPTRHKRLAAARAQGGGMGTPAAAAGNAAGFDSPSSSPSKKSVRFSLRSNLVNVIGQPPAPEEVRTPPTAKPKGPALKRESQFGAPHSAPEQLTTRAGQSRLAQVSSYLSAKKQQQQQAGAGSGTPAARPAAGRGKKQQQGGPGTSSKKGKQQRRQSLPTPGSAKRARAAEFF